MDNCNYIFKVSSIYSKHECKQKHTENLQYACSMIHICNITNNNRLKTEFNLGHLGSATVLKKAV